MMNDDTIIKQLKDAVSRLEQRVAYLERENNRRKNETNNISNAIRRG